jgi:hypothetical protein
MDGYFWACNRIFGRPVSGRARGAMHAYMARPIANDSKGRSGRSSRDRCDRRIQCQSLSHFLPSYTTSCLFSLSAMMLCLCAANEAVAAKLQEGSLSGREGKNPPRGREKRRAEATTESNQKISSKKKNMRAPLSNKDNRSTVLAPARHTHLSFSHPTQPIRMFVSSTILQLCGGSRSTGDHGWQT